MEKNFKTIFGGNLEWHTDPADKPNIKLCHNIIVAYYYKKGFGYDDIADFLYFTTYETYLGDQIKTRCVAWAYFNTDIPNKIFEDELKAQRQYEADHAEEIKAKRIADLEAELKQLKGDD